MRRTICERIHSDETGFTTIELLVVILIIGIMVVIALPAFLGQSSKSQDASAKSDARNLASQVDSCYQDRHAYNRCTSPQNTGLNLGNNPGEVEVKSATAHTYTVVGYSKSGNHFFIKKRRRGVTTRTCDTAGKGSCRANGRW
jgi:type IV pilus assembly protein PilA